MYLYSLAPGKFEWNVRKAISKLILVIDGWGISYEIALEWLSRSFTGDKSTLVKVMTWCRQVMFNPSPEPINVDPGPRLNIRKDVFS